MNRSTILCRRVFKNAASATLAAAILWGPIRARAESAQSTLSDIYRQNNIDTASIADLRSCGTVTTIPAALNRFRDSTAFNGEDILENLPGKRLYTIYSDMNHSDLRPHQIFFSERNVSAMIRNSIRHVFLEIDIRDKYLMQDIASGDFSEEAAVNFLKLQDRNSYLKDSQKDEYYRQEARGLIALGKAGIKVHAVDERQADAPIGTPEQLELVERFVKALEDFRKTHCPDAQQMNFKSWYGAYYLNYLPAAEKDGQLQEAIDAYKEVLDRIEDDSRLARKITALAQGERSAIFYGGAHGLKENDLDDLLGRDQCARIALIGDEDFYADKWLPENKLRSAPDQPEFYYFADRDKAYAVRPLPTDLTIIGPQP